MDHVKKTEKMFYIGPSEKTKIAFMEYEIKEDLLIIRHTEVSKSFQGQGIGILLVEAAVKHARDHGLLIYPKCGYAFSILKKRPDLKDVLSKKNIII